MSVPMMSKTKEPWTAKYQASVGVFVCGACGRHGKNKATLGDEACFLNSVECWPSSIELRSNGLVRFAVRCDEDWVEPSPLTSGGEEKKL